MCPQVKFSSRTHIFCIPLLAEMSREEMEASFYTVAEENQLKSDAVNVAKLLRTKGPAAARRDGATPGGGDDLCARGLEHLLSAERFKRRIAERNAVVRGVLDEQEKRRRRPRTREGREDETAAEEELPAASAEEEIARASREHSRPARNDAATKGTLDAAFALASMHPARAPRSKHRPKRTGNNSTALKRALDILSVSGQGPRQQVPATETLPRPLPKLPGVEHFAKSVEGRRLPTGRSVEGRRFVADSVAIPAIRTAFR